MSEVKVNKISPRTNCGTVTLGDSGDTFTIPAGVSITNSGTASGFGATGAVSWNTTVKTSTFTAVAGEGYFVNTTGGAVTVNLPAGSAGAVVGIKDYANTFGTNAVTVAPNGSDKIGGDSTADSILSTEGLALTFVFVDSTQGWLVTDSGLQSEMPTGTFITATGGTITTCGNCKVHTFTGPGTFTVCSVGNSGGSSTVEYLVIAGGGGSGGPGGNNSGGGGGAGGYRTNHTNCTPSPSSGGLPVTASSYPITVGGGGGGGISCGTPNPSQVGISGSNSVFSTITSAGGAYGGGGAPSGNGPISNGGDGGSGGGGGGGNAGTPTCGGLGGTGNTPPTSPPQGNNGGLGGNNPLFPPGSDQRGGGGGGASAAGGDAPSSPLSSGDGGAGLSSDISFSSVGRGGGGAGGFSPPHTSPATASDGGGGQGSTGTANTGGGGGGSSGPGVNGNSGGSGIVIIRYKFQN